VEYSHRSVIVLATERLRVQVATTAQCQLADRVFDKKKQKYVISNVRQQQRLTARFYFKVRYSQTCFGLGLVLGATVRYSSPTSPLMEKFVFHCSHVIQ